MNDLLAPLPIAPIPRIGLRAEECAESLSVSSRTLANWRAAGIGPPSALINGTRIYPVDALRDWLADRAMEPQEITLKNTAADTTALS